MDCVVEFVFMECAVKTEDLFNLFVAFIYICLTYPLTNTLFEKLISMYNILS